MRQIDKTLLLSATDLANFLGCRHRTALDMAVAIGARPKPATPPDPLAEILWERGLEHEKRYVDSLRGGSREIADLREGTFPERKARTLAAMVKGAHVIVQGALSDGQWMGYPDLLQRVETPSAFGPWSYEVADTKLSRETRAGTILQLGLYSEMLATAQGCRPERFHVITPDPVFPRQTYRVDDYAAYFRLVRRQMLETVAQAWDRVAADNYPDPVDHCEVCRWQGTCASKRRADDHLSLVAGITRVQRRELETHDVQTLTSLAHLPLPLGFKPIRGSAESYARVREQARLQDESRDRIPPLHELLAVEAERGLCRLPEPSLGDLFLDLEGDPFAVEGGREYLFGLASADGGYRSKWAFTEGEERVAFEWTMDEIAASVRAHPEMHVYHYAPYEPAAFKRLMGRHVTRERELDAMLRSGRFVDLYAVVRQGVRAGVERYSIKNLEPLYAFTREVPLAVANNCLRAMALGLESQAADEVPAAVRDVVQGYNRDDCISTVRLRDWLEAARAGLVAQGTDVPRDVLRDGAAPDQLDEKTQRVEELRARLLSGVPVEPTERNAEQQATWLLAYSLDFHRRERKAAWWEYYRLIELPEEELLDEREAVAGMTFVERVVVAKKSVVDRYRYPPQEMELDPGDDVRLQDETTFGSVVGVDRERDTIDVKKGLSREALHPSAMFAHTHISPGVIETALLQIGEGVVAGAAAYGAARALLERRPPRLLAGSFDPRENETVLDFAIRAGASLNESVLAIQGPPGSGKTYCGAKMICELVRRGKKVGVTATSHKVIRNLLDAVAKEADSTGTQVKLAHKGGDDVQGIGAPPRIAPLEKNAAARDALDAGLANVVGGTAWLWSDEKLASAVDVLFVDEAGQIALANVVAVSQAAGSVVLLGDPQQLEQPIKGTHPEGVGVSALEHLLGGHQTIPADRGIFLPQTWRLAPRICDLTSELFYEKRLTARPGLELQRIAGVDGLPESGPVLVAVDHDGCRNWSVEEVGAVAGLVERLTRMGATWTDAKATTRQIRGADILIVAPYNSQVTRLAERLKGTGARVGTVDKFQGQEAPIVVYSMATSRPEDAPRGMAFLYSLHRLNVATSRARCLAIVVANPRLFEPECHSPGQMRLANGMCRFQEMATKSDAAAGYGQAGTPITESLRLKAIRVGEALGERGDQEGADADQSKRSGATQMLGLTLREEFRGKRLKGTAIELANDSKTGATQIAAQEFLEITYPTHDLLKGIEAVGPNHGRPVVMIGERGLGKSHLMAALYHAVNDPAATSAWLKSWATTLGDEKIGKIAQRDKMSVIGESLHRQRYKFLWDVLFELHPHGTYIKGKWEGMGAAKTDIPSDKLILELLQHTPTMLLLDEFQTWYDGLTNTKQYPWKNWAFNFIQILSEIAKEHPDLLVLVISVRNGGSDAYQQVHRVNPVAIDFKSGGNAERIQQDRRRMLLHRLFANRLQIPGTAIQSLLSTHISEYFRLLDIAPQDQDRKRREFVESWPYAPHLLRLLEEQVLIATDAQETRDMIRILASLFKSRGELAPVLTAADFRLDDDTSGIGALLDSVSNEHHRTLRAKAQQNIISVTEAVPNHDILAPHLQEILGALWLRSIAVGNLAGAERATLQVDITRNKAVDDNAFQVELATVVENSFNIHQDGPRLVFREEENPQAKLMAYARNDKLFGDGSDLTQLAKEIRYVIGGSEEVAKGFRVIALPKSWLTDPWPTLDEAEQPDRWDDRLPILVLPEEIDSLNVRLGRWLKDHLQKGRNTVRFLLPRTGSSNSFQDRDLLILTRAAMKAHEWSGQAPEYKKMQIKYQGELRDILKKRFDRFAVLRNWDFTDPSQSVFSVESLKKQGAQIPEGIEEAIVSDLFVPEDFEASVLASAHENASIGKLLRELQEPRPAGQDCIPWLGETAMKERILRLCARGIVVINLRNMELLQAQPGEDEDAAWKRMRTKLSYTGRQLDEIVLLEPSAIASTGGTKPADLYHPDGTAASLFDAPGGPTLVPAMDGRPPMIAERGGPAASGAFSDELGSGSKPRVTLINPATSPLNLIGKLEGWGIGPATRISDVSIRLSAATGSQLKDLLKKLPDGMTFELSLAKEEDS